MNRKKETNRIRLKKAIRIATLSAILGLLLVIATFPSGNVTRAEFPLDQLPEGYLDRIPMYGGTATFLLAEELELDKIFDKSLDASSGSSAGRSGSSTDEVGIGILPMIAENEPTVTANPTDNDNVIAGNHFTTFGTNRCVAYFSTDGGETFSDPIFMPHLTPESFCSDPVLAFSPDGELAYYAYMDIKILVIFEFSLFIIRQEFDIVVSVSDDGGATWTGPVVALDGAPSEFIFNFETGDVTIIEGFDYDKPWIGTHVAVNDDDDDDDDDDESDGNGQANSDFVYVSATRFDNFLPFECAIDFASSGDRGASWSAATTLDSSVGGCGNPVVVQGSRPTGGLGNDVVVAWYHSGTDGWLEGTFEIRTRYSTDNGGTWDPIVTAVTDEFETPFWLGPFASYMRWWATMMPDVEIGQDGNGHIVYTHDPAENAVPGFFGFSDTSEDGDIRYISSGGAPFTSWSSPITVNDDGLVRAQGYPAMEVEYDEVHVIWEDHRTGPTLPDLPELFPASSNLFFDMFSAVIDNGEVSANERLTTETSINDFIFLGDYNDLTISGSLVFGIWTDRRHQVDIFAFEDNTFGAEVD